MVRQKRIDLRGKFYNITELQDYRNMLAKEANVQLRALEKAGKTQYAYRTAKRNIKAVRGSGRYRRYEEKKDGYDRDSLPQLRWEIEELEHFLDSKTSTVQGSLDYEERMLNQARERGLKVKNAQEFWNFLSSETYKNLANKKIDSAMLQEFWDRASNRGYGTKRLYDALKEYQKGEVSLKELFQKHRISLKRRKAKGETKGSPGRPRKDGSPTAGVPSESMAKNAGKKQAAKGKYLREKERKAAKRRKALNRVARRLGI